MQFIQGSVIFFTFVTLLLACSIASFVIYILFFCFLKESDNKTKKKIKIFWSIILTFTLIYLIFFVIFIVYSAWIKDDVDWMNCSIA